MCGLPSYFFFDTYLASIGMLDTNRLILRSWKWKLLCFSSCVQEAMPPFDAMDYGFLLHLAYSCRLLAVKDFSY
jgi:hypothetical protein